MYAAGRYVNNALNGVWHAVIGRRLIAANINSKVPVADLEAFLKAEKEVMQDVRQRVASVGIDPKGALPRNLSPQQQIALVKAWEEARSAHPTHGLLAKQLEHAKWHAMHKAPADYVNFFTRETVYASGAGLIGGAIWHYGYTAPLDAKTEDYFKQLYKQYPEYWPALAASAKN